MKPPYLPRSRRSELKAITAVTKPRLRSYILRPDGRIRQVSMMHSMLWQKAGNNRIAHTRLLNGTVEVSTVFISVPVPLLFSRHPRFFETMVFYNNDMDGDRWLYDTLEDAVLGHMEIVEKIQARRPVCLTDDIKLKITLGNELLFSLFPQATLKAEGDHLPYQQWKIKFREAVPYDRINLLMQQLGIESDQDREEFMHYMWQESRRLRGIE